MNNSNCSFTNNSNSNNQITVSFVQTTSYTKKEKYGKNIFYINDTKTEYTLNIHNSNNEKYTILLKYIAKKDDTIQYNLKNTDVKWEKYDNNTYKLSHSNIKPHIDLNSNYKINYLIRLYNIFSFEGNNKPKNILVEEEPLMSFRKELNEKEMKNDTIEYVINFGQLIRSNYFISIIGEAINESNVEYFAYKYIEFSVRPVISNNDNSFDYSWIFIIVILLLMLTFVIVFLIRVYINIKNNANDLEDLNKPYKNIN